MRSSTLLRICIFTILGLTTITASAQITITSSFWSAKVGERETESSFEADNDGGLPFPTVPCVSAILAASGANQTWDFTASCTFSSPAATTITDYGSNVAADVPMGTDGAFAAGNLYLRTYGTAPPDEASAWTVFNLSSGGVTQFGFVGVEPAPPDFDTTLVVNSPASQALKLPMTYLTAWNDSTSWSVDGGTTVTSIAEDNVVDGWGTLVTPAGSLPALRLSVIRRTRTIASGIEIFMSTEYSYEFMTTGSISASIDHDNAGTASFADYLTTSSTTLPVELTSFDVVRSGDEAILSWRTLSETNNSGFAVEHAIGAGAFEQAGFVEGYGTVNEVHDYRFSVALAETGLHRFRLRQIDLDGTFGYSPIVELNFEAPDRFTLLQAYPNPFNPSTVIAYDLPDADNVTLGVFDALGRRVAELANGRQPAGRHQVRFDASGLPSGLYLYRLEAGARTETRSVLLMR